MDNLEENSGAMDFQLTSTDLAELRATGQGADVAGERYLPGTSNLFADTPAL